MFDHSLITFFGMIDLHLIWQILHGWNFLRNKKIDQNRIMQLEK